MKAYIDKSALVAEIEKLQLCTMDEHMNFYSAEAQGEYNALSKLESFIDTLEVKEINSVWHDTRRTIPEDGNEQIICIKEDGLAVSTIGKIVNGTIKWAYFNDLLNISDIQVKEVKEKDLEKEIKLWFDYGLPNNDEFLDHIKETAKHFFELGLKAQKGE